MSEVSLGAARRPLSWIVSPAFDLFFVANLGWLLLLIPGLLTSSGTGPVAFWQLYFITTPHRWITLLLVATDPDRRDGRDRLFVAIAVLIGFIVAGLWLGTGTFLCLLMIDYIWNAWHFASQHSGILRIYSRKCGGGSAWLERYALRAFLFYAIARTAEWATGWIEADPSAFAMLRLSDRCMLAIPLILLGLNLSGFRRERWPKMIYLLSICLLYGLLLVSLGENWRMLAITCMLASSLFHAVEYLAIVSHYAWQRQKLGSESYFRQMSQRWVEWLAAFMMLVGWLAVLLEESWFNLYAGLNLWAAFLHYTYDGLIWKLRRPATASALGLPSSSPIPAKA